MVESRVRRLRPAIDLGATLETQANQGDVTAARGAGERRVSGPRTARAEIGASFAQQRHRLSMAAEASEIQGHVSVAMNGVVRVQCIEEPAYRRCISIETGLVQFLVRLDVSDRSHDCLTGQIITKTGANSRARGRVLKKNRGLGWLC